MARLKFFHDYNPMRKGFPYVVIRENGAIEHGRIYAHSLDDATNRLIGQYAPFNSLQVFPAVK